MKLIALTTLAFFIAPTEKFTRFNHPGENFGELRASWVIPAESTNRTGGQIRLRLRNKAKASDHIVNVYFGDYSDWRERHRHYCLELGLNWQGLQDGVPSREPMEGYVGYFQTSSKLRDGRTYSSTNILVASDMCAIAVHSQSFSTDHAARAEQLARWASAEVKRLFQVVGTGSSRRIIEKP